MRDNVKTTPSANNNPSVSILPKKEAKILSAPTGQLHTNIPSIEELKRKAFEKSTVTTEDISNKPQAPFTYDQLKMHWRAFAYEVQNSHKQGGEVVHSLMNKKDPILNDLVITYEVENVFMEELLKNNFGNEILAYLRSKLNNWAISFEVIIKDNTDELSHKTMTGKERFQLMAQRNVNLNTLLSTFNLDIKS